MGYTKEKKEKREKLKKNLNKNRGKLLYDNFKKNWLQKRPILIFVVIFAILMGLFYSLWFTSFFENNVQHYIIKINATISNFILNIFGQHTKTMGDMIYSSSFSISIKRGCDAVEAMALFTSVLLAFPAPWKSKLIGLTGGLFMLFLLNLVRIISLFLTGIYFPKAFEIMHIEVWQVLFIFFALGLWIFWIQKITKQIKHVEK
ncbi:MAG: exosortase H [Bacteroidetes bacterium]|nr:exosortase H [Bacteroidota bacterium]